MAMAMGCSPLSAAFPSRTNQIARQRHRLPREKKLLSHLFDLFAIFKNNSALIGVPDGALAAYLLHRKCNRFTGLDWRHIIVVASSERWRCARAPFRYNDIGEATRAQVTLGL